MSIKRDLYEALDHAYTKAELDKGMKPLVFDFVTQNKRFCLQEGMSASMIPKLKTKNFNKADLINLCCVPFLTCPLFEAFLKSLPREMATILGELVWVEELHYGEIKSKLRIEICEKLPRQYSWGYDTYRLKSMYHFFVVKSEWNQERSYSLSFPLVFRKRMATYYPKPKNFDIHSTTAQKTDHSFNAEQDIFLELPRLLAYQGQGNIKLTKKLRPVLSGMNKMQRTLTIREFFEDTKDRVLKNLRTNAIAGILTTFSDIKENEPAKLIKSFFKQYQKKQILQPSSITHTYQRNRSFGPLEHESY